MTVQEFRSSSPSSPQRRSSFRYCTVRVILFASPPSFHSPTAPFPHHTRTGARAVLVTSLGALRAFDIDIFLAVSVPPEIPP